MYNILNCSPKCPHCGAETLTEVEFRFGRRNLDRYQLGDTLLWDVGKGRNAKGAPPETFSGEGYAECTVCELDFWVLIAVQRGVITDVRIDPNRTGFKPS